MQGTKHRISGCSYGSEKYRYCSFSSRTKRKANQFADTVAKNITLQQKVFNVADDAMEKADIIVTATNSSYPVYSRSLKPGVHLNAVGSFKPDMQNYHQNQC